MRLAEYDDVAEPAEEVRVDAFIRADGILGGHLGVHRHAHRTLAEDWVVREVGFGVVTDAALLVEVIGVVLVDVPGVAELAEAVDRAFCSYVSSSFFLASMHYAFRYTLRLVFGGHLVGACEVCTSLEVVRRRRLITKLSGAAY